MLYLKPPSYRKIHSFSRTHVCSVRSSRSSRHFLIEPVPSIYFELHTGNPPLRSPALDKTAWILSKTLTTQPFGHRSASGRAALFPGSAHPFCHRKQSLFRASQQLARFLVHLPVRFHPRSKFPALRPSPPESFRQHHTFFSPGRTSHTSPLSPPALSPYTHRLKITPGCPAGRKNTVLPGSTSNSRRQIPPEIFSSNPAPGRGLTDCQQHAQILQPPVYYPRQTPAQHRLSLRAPVSAAPAYSLQGARPYGLRPRSRYSCPVFFHPSAKTDLPSFCTAQTKKRHRSEPPPVSPKDACAPVVSSCVPETTPVFPFDFITPIKFSYKR